MNVRVTHFGIGLLSVNPLGQRIFGASQKPMTDQQIVLRADALAQGLKLYFTGKPCKYGHIASRFTTSRACTECNVRHQRKYHASAKGQASLQRMWQKQKERRAAGDLEFINKRRITHKKSKAKRKDKINSYIRNVRRQNPQYLIRNRLNSRLHTLCRLKGTSKAAEFSEIVGCTPAFLANWLENKFCSGMNWSNHGEWHIDHIRPCASFDLTDPEQQKQCFHYTNLQPLWAEDNRVKSDKWEDAA